MLREFWNDRCARVNLLTLMAFGLTLICSAMQWYIGPLFIAAGMFFLSVYWFGWSEQQLSKKTLKLVSVSEVYLTLVLFLAIMAFLNVAGGVLATVRFVKVMWLLTAVLYLVIAAIVYFQAMDTFRRERCLEPYTPREPAPKGA